jgi:tripartite-type tricarboxylate transporter receptor subunit TctC
VTLGATQSLGALAQAWPEKPVKFIVPFAPGGGADVATRMLAEQLRNVWGGVSAVVDNKPGGNTIIAASSVINAPRDGQTFLVTIGLTMQLPYLGQKLNFDPMVDLVPVGAITVEQLVLVVNTSSGIQNFAGLVDALKNNPKGMAFGTFGVGSTAHLVAAQMGKVLKRDLLPVHYRGAAPAVQGLLSGEVQMALSNVGTVQQHIAAGKLKAIAATGAKRYRFIPDVPTFTELGVPELEFVSAIGVFAAKGTKPEVIKKLSADMQKALAAPELVAKINGFYQEPGNSILDFDALVKRDDEMAGQLIKTHQIRIE